MRELGRRVVDERMVAFRVGREAGYLVRRCVCDELFDLSLFDVLRVVVLS